MTSTKTPMKKIRLSTPSQSWNGTWLTPKEHSAKCGTSWSPWLPSTPCSCLLTSWHLRVSIWSRQKKMELKNIIKPCKKSNLPSTSSTSLKSFWTSSRGLELTRNSQLSVTTTSQDSSYSMLLPPFLNSSSKKGWTTTFWNSSESSISLNWRSHSPSFWLVCSRSTPRKDKMIWQVSLDLSFMSFTWAISWPVFGSPSVVLTIAESG